VLPAGMGPDDMRSTHFSLLVGALCSGIDRHHVWQSTWENGSCETFSRDSYVRKNKLIRGASAPVQCHPRGLLETFPPPRRPRQLCLTRHNSDPPPPMRLRVPVPMLCARALSLSSRVI
jgi:hypothetical protein